ALSASARAYLDIGLSARIRVRKDLVVNGQSAWGGTQPYGQLIPKVLIVDKLAFDLDPSLLAAVLMHEAVHSTQWVPWPESRVEKPAYQVESDTLRALGITGRTSQLEKNLTGASDWRWLRESALEYRTLGVENPALTYP